MKIKQIKQTSHTWSCVKILRCVCVVFFFFFDNSAKEGTGVEQAFEIIAQMAAKHHIQDAHQITR